MARVKDLDCVEMKNRIQAKLLKRYEGMTEEEIQEDQRRRIEANPILGPLYRQLREKSSETGNPIADNSLR